MVNQRTHNAAITPTERPERNIPVLIPGTKMRHDGGLFLPEPTYVRLVDESWFEGFFRTKNRKRFALQFGEVTEAERKELEFLMTFLPAVFTKNEGEIRDAIRHYTKDITDEETLVDELNYLWGRVEGSNPIYLVMTEMNRRLRDARLVMWQPKREGKILPGLLCPDLKTGLFTLWASRLRVPRGTSFCLRCGTLFPRSREMQKYCTTQCQAAAAMARKRERDKIGGQRKAFPAGRK